MGRRKNRRRGGTKQILTGDEKVAVSLDRAVRKTEDSYIRSRGLSLLSQFRSRGMLSPAQWKFAESLIKQEAAASRIKKTIKPKTKTVEWFVYAMRSGDFIKIGYSKNPKGRVKEVQTGNPLSVEIVWTLGFTANCHAKNYERKLHKKLSEYRVRGEWFRPQVLEYLEDSTFLDERLSKNLS